jgi:hypothetical protein
VVHIATTGLKGLNPVLLIWRSLYYVFSLTDKLFKHLDVNSIYFRITMKASFNLISRRSVQPFIKIPKTFIAKQNIIFPAFKSLLRVLLPFYPILAYLKAGDPNTNIITKYKCFYILILCSQRLIWDIKQSDTRLHLWRPEGRHDAGIFTRLQQYSCLLSATHQPRLSVRPRNIFTRATSSVMTWKSQTNEDRNWAVWTQQEAKGDHDINIYNELLFIY